MLTAESFLETANQEQKIDWRYNQLPDYAKDYIDTIFLQLDQLLKEKNKVYEIFEETIFSTKQISEDTLRTVFNEKLQELYMKKLRLYFNRLIDHFNGLFDLSIKSYGLIDDFLFKKMDKIHSKSFFLECYYRIGDISDINKAGVEKMKKDFKLLVESRRNDYKLSGDIKNKKIRFNNVLSYEWYGDTDRISSIGDSDILKFFKAIFWFEDEEGYTSDLNFFYEIPSRRTPFFSKREFNEHHHPIIRGFRAFKNGNLDIYFNSNESIERFIKKFALKV